MNILLLGHKGMLGSELFGRLSIHHEVIGKDMDDFDIASAGSCQALISEAVPDVVMNAAAYTDVDGCESNRDTCLAVNAEGTKNVALACRDRNIKIVHFSTDYVFDGTREGSYREEDDCHPLNVYGQSKWMGERYLQQFSENYILVRTAWLYGKNGKNFVKTILNKAMMEKKLEVVDDQIGSPTYTKDLATAVQYLLENNYTGMFHITNRGSCSWYEFAVKILAYSGITNVEISPITSERLTRAAKRPANSVLSCRKFIEVTGKTMSYWQVALQTFISRDLASKKPLG